MPTGKLMVPTAWRTFFAAIIVIVGSSTTTSGQTIDKTVLEQVKDATVFIKLSAGKLHGSGSGFVMRVTGDTVLIMTNRHVAAPSEDELPEKATIELKVVFRSGTPQEQELPARLLASDDREVRDLAVLEVKGVRAPPRPIVADQPNTEADFIETMHVYALGFPLGGMVQEVADNIKANPALTVVPMTIASLRRDEENRLARVQLNGAMIEGNSGGPIVDARGRLVGVAVSRIRNEAVGFAIPPTVISAFLAGDIGSHTAEIVTVQGGNAQLKLALRLVDPLGKVKGVAIRYARQPTPPPGTPGAAPATPGGPAAAAVAAAPSATPATPNTPPPLLPGGTSVTLAVQGDTAGGQFAVPIATPEDRKLLMQIIVTDASGRIRTSKPAPITLPEKPGPILGWSAGPRTPATLAKFSCETNLGEGIKIGHKVGETTIDMPGGVALINAPQYKLFTAPCALVRVDSDFTALVVVTNEFDPGSDVITMPNKARAQMTFQGAGLLVWQDEKNFIRLERCKGSAGGISLAHRILVEVYKAGREEVTSYMDVPEGPVALVVVRKGASVQFLFAIPPKQLVVFKELAVDFRKELFVGVSATNLSTHPFQAKLERFSLKNLDEKDIEVKPYPLSKLVGSLSVRRKDGTWVMEGATLRVTKTVGRVQAGPQLNMDQFKRKWSDNRQLNWPAAKAGDALTLEVPVETDGKYELKAVFTRAPDYAKVKLSLDDKSLLQGKFVDLYGDEIRPTGAMSLGSHTLKKGNHRLTVTVLGKNEKSTDYHFGLDELQLIPAK